MSILEINDYYKIRGNLRLIELSEIKNTHQIQILLGWINLVVYQGWGEVGLRIWNL